MQVLHPSLRTRLPAILPAPWPAPLPGPFAACGLALFLGPAKGFLDPAGVVFDGAAAGRLRPGPFFFAAQQRLLLHSLEDSCQHHLHFVLQGHPQALPLLLPGQLRHFGWLKWVQLQQELLQEGLAKPSKIVHQQHEVLESSAMLCQQKFANQGQQGLLLHLPNLIKLAKHPAHHQSAAAFAMLSPNS